MPNELDNLEGIRLVRAVSFVAIGSEQLTVGNTPMGLNPPEGAKMAVLQVQSGKIRVTFDGTVPTSSVGYIFSTGSDKSSAPLMEISNYHNLHSLLMVKAQGTPKLRVTYGRLPTEEEAYGPP